MRCIQNLMETENLKKYSFYLSINIKTYCVFVVKICGNWK